MTEQQRRAIVDFALHRIDKKALNTALGFDVDANPDAVFKLLDDARCVGDADSVESALMIANGRTGDIDLVPTLIALLRATGHKRHEDLARWLQSLRDPRAVDALYESALMKHEYLEYDNSHALARKCTWALADIGTPEAKQKLRLLAKCEDQEIAGYAQKRLDRWEMEFDRKRPHAR
jgi:hypothetical protein